MDNGGNIIETLPDDSGDDEATWSDPEDDTPTYDF